MDSKMADSKMGEYEEQIRSELVEALYGFMRDEGLAPLDIPWSSVITWQPFARVAARFETAIREKRGVGQLEWPTAAELAEEMKELLDPEGQWEPIAASILKFIRNKLQDSHEQFLYHACGPHAEEVNRLEAEVDRLNEEKRLLHREIAEMRAARDRGAVASENARKFSGEF